LANFQALTNVSKKFPKVVNLPDPISSRSEETVTINMGLQCELLETLICGLFRVECSKPMALKTGGCSLCFAKGSKGGLIDRLLYV